VASLGELRLALAARVDVIDLKAPADGALGAWPRALLAEAVRRVAGRRPVSATVGDLPPDDAHLLAEAARATAATGVDVVKLGFFPGADHRALAGALAPATAGGARLVAVLMADRSPDLGLAPALAAAGFWGVMLDTEDKRAGSLLAHLRPAELGRWVADARAHGLATGLAGSLRLADIPALAPLGPDFLGFRGALCLGGRASPLDPARLGAAREALDAWAAAAAAGAVAATCHDGAAANMLAH
jgi:(5-formylfuran-3-yl)methyl phosphate synthase